jgi:hypothetical protein
MRRRACQLFTGTQRRRCEFSPVSRLGSLRGVFALTNECHRAPCLLLSVFLGKLIFLLPSVLQAASSLRRRAGSILGG